MTILIDGGPDSNLPKLDIEIRCPNHPHLHPEFGFGLAGGGYGTYTMCPECARILSKDQEDEA